MSNIDKRALRKAAMHAKTEDDWGCDADNFHDKATPDAVLALLDELEAAEKRIAELEARKVTVKLPSDYRNDDGSINDDMFNTCAVVGAFRDALAAAGIGVKGE
ncbi:ead/Ea22-like family protein [Citrobacter freundii]|uniref:ead/Ea22-like family protein n=1 Tax=Citrobacter freundii TaxID=546 RepID=UPI00259E8FD6|nr:ead/Ea22-like family protein [Citrobacter freundii]EKU0868569.1 ead/Ea22-like family protein [Citrobacter freundii]EKU8447392.1 ead/Ea22-like family protein [Citrobacter freundii]EKU8456470.1 ead/Ea22-like family protein [Citrobacter freundii]EKV0934804.1 ead/Ea22-like family protein [Citrobacter freundii]